MMEDNDEEGTSPAKATDEDIQKVAGDDNENLDQEEDAFVYLKSSSIISILIIVIFSLVCILTTSLLIKTALHTHGITRTLSVYLGFTPNRTEDESILTYWPPKSLNNEQPIETTTTTIITVPPPPPSPSIILSPTERKAQKIFRNIILPSLLFSAILCGILAFCMRLHHHNYPAWGARPKRPKHYLTVAMKSLQTTNSV